MVSANTMIKRRHEVNIMHAIASRILLSGGKKTLTDGVRQENRSSPSSDIRDTMRRKPSDDNQCSDLPGLSFNKTLEEVKKGEEVVSQDRKGIFDSSSKEERDLDPGKPGNDAASADSIQIEAGSSEGERSYAAVMNAEEYPAVDPDDSLIPVITAGIDTDVPESSELPYMASSAPRLSASGGGFQNTPPASFLSVDRDGEVHPFPSSRSPSIVPRGGITPSSGTASEGYAPEHAAQHPGDVPDLTVDSPSGAAKIPVQGGIEEPLGKAGAETPLNGPWKPSTSDKVSTPSSQDSNGHAGYGHTSEREGVAPTGHQGKNLDHNAFGSKSGYTEASLEQLAEKSSTPTGDSGNAMEAMVRQDRISPLEGSSHGPIEIVRNPHGDSTTWTRMPGEPRGLSPQTLINTIIEENSQIFIKGGRVKMTLNPPHLGSLDLDIRIRNNKVNVLFVADSPEVQQSLQAGTDLLKTALSQQGYKMDGYSVLLQGNTDSNMEYFSGDGGPWRHTRNEYDHGQKDREEPIQLNLTPDAEGGNQKGAVRSNSISVFV
jgi:outer membrane protein OmpA-like peptidoglycan-associated protein